MGVKGAGYIPRYPCVSLSQFNGRETDMENMVTERTIAAALIAVGLVLAALILRGGYEVAAGQQGAYVVNKFSGATWWCSVVGCARVDNR
jgi:hypothetical protein